MKKETKEKISKILLIPSFIWFFIIVPIITIETDGTTGNYYTDIFLAAIIPASLATAIFWFGIMKRGEHGRLQFKRI